MNRGLLIRMVLFVVNLGRYFYLKGYREILVNKVLKFNYVIVIWYLKKSNKDFVYVMCILCFNYIF